MTRHISSSGALPQQRLNRDEVERILNGSRHGITAYTMACVTKRTMTPSLNSVARAADLLDELVAHHRAQRVDGERLGNGGVGSTTWWPT